jgi:uncharacterized protein with FMN-binding domain
MAASIVASGAAFAACDSGETVTGDYHYTSYGTNYGFKVNVTVESSDKGDRIKKIDIDDSTGYVAATSAEYGYTPETWTNGYDALYANYVGAYVTDILAKEVVTDATGVPLETTADGYVDFGSSYIITGATQSAGRYLLAVQDALKNLDGYKVVEGEYHYANAYGGSDYGIKVRVVTKDSTILKVTKLSSDYVDATAKEYGYTNYDSWANGLSGLLAKYEGKTVAEIKAITVVADTETVGSAETYFSSVKGQPSSVSDSNYVITGATQGSGRLMLAVQNALSKI